MSFLLNEDFAGFTEFRTLEQMNEEELRKQLEFYASGSPNNTIIFNLNAQKAYFDSRIFEPIWNNLEQDAEGNVTYRGKKVEAGVLKAIGGELTELRYAIFTRTLYERVKNPMGLRLDYGRALGMKIYISLRANDVHKADSYDSILLSDFWREHQGQLTAPYPKNGWWWGLSMDYACPEIYQRHLALAREYLTRYEPDGLEVDWMRSPYPLKPGMEQENAHVLTEFMQDVKNIALDVEKKCGHPIDIVARIPERPDDARRMGFQVKEWVNRGLVNQLVLTPYFGMTNHDLPIEVWRDMLGQDVKISGCLEIFCKGSPNDKSFFITPEIAFGHAASYHYRGADDIYLFNYMDKWLYTKDEAIIHAEKEIISHIGDIDYVNAARRRHIVSYVHGLSRAVGMPQEHILPMKVTNWSDGFLRLNVGGCTARRQASIAISCSGELPKEVFCNSSLCAKSQRTFSDKVPDNIPGCTVYDIPEGALHDGDNVLYFKGDTVLDWCEVDLEAAR